MQLHRHPIDGESREHRQFLAMDRALLCHGGLITGDDLTLLLRTRSDQPISIIARWIVARKIMSFTWREQTLIPLFQFNLRDVSLRTSVMNAADELRTVFDDWELVRWFTEPNGWLRDAAPVDLIHYDDQAVLQAARADRFVAHV